MHLQHILEFTMGDSMNNDGTSHYEGALLEDVLDKVKLIAEGQTGIWNKVDSIDKNVSALKEDLSHVKLDVSQLKQDVSQLKDDMVIVKHAATEQSTDLDDHEARLKKLEQIAA
jgi:peptidoglycan hydrolase CwlO-like protein